MGYCAGVMALRPGLRSKGDRLGVRGERLGVMGDRVWVRGERLGVRVRGERLGIGGQGYVKGDSPLFLLLLPTPNPSGP